MSGELIDLRKRAEDRLARRGTAALPSANLPAEVLLDELEVHRIELQMQYDELRLQRDEAEATRNRFAALCDIAPVGLLLIDVHSRILDGNSTAWQLFGLHHQFEHGTDLFNHLEWADASRLRTALARGGPAVMEVRIRPRRRNPFRALLSLAQESESGGTFQVAIIETTSQALDERSLAPGADRGAVDILIVEPYAPGRRALRDSLDELGYQTIEAENGDQALHVLTSRPPTLVIADCAPGSAGLLGSLRSRWPELPAVLLCTDRDIGVATPRSTVLLPKPIAFDDLDRAVASLIAGR